MPISSFSETDPLSSTSFTSLGSGNIISFNNLGGDLTGTSGDIDYDRFEGRVLAVSGIIENKTPTLSFLSEIKSIDVSPQPVVPPFLYSLTFNSSSADIIGGTTLSFTGSFTNSPSSSFELYFISASNQYTGSGNPNFVGGSGSIVFSGIPSGSETAFVTSASVQVATVLQDLTLDFTASLQSASLTDPVSTLSNSLLTSSFEANFYNSSLSSYYTSILVDYDRQPPGSNNPEIRSAGGSFPGGPSYAYNEDADTHTYKVGKDDQYTTAQFSMLRGDFMRFTKYSLQVKFDAVDITSSTEFLPFIDIHTAAQNDFQYDSEPVGTTSSLSSHPMTVNVIYDEDDDTKKIALGLRPDGGGKEFFNAQPIRFGEWMDIDVEMTWGEYPNGAVTASIDGNLFETSSISTLGTNAMVFYPIFGLYQDGDIGLRNNGDSVMHLRRIRMGDDKGMYRIVPNYSKIESLINDSLNQGSAKVFTVPTGDEIKEPTSASYMYFNYSSSTSAPLGYADYDQLLADLSEAGLDTTDFSVANMKTLIDGP